MRGIYILSNTVLEKLSTIKIGMSMNLQNRLYNYRNVFSNNKFLFIYEMKNYDKDHILFIEDIIKKYTSKFQSELFSTEYRTLDNIVLDEYNSLIVDVLNKFKIKYILHKNYISNKKNNIKISDIKINNIDPHKLFPGCDIIGIIDYLDNTYPHKSSDVKKSENCKNHPIMEKQIINASDVTYNKFHELLLDSKSGKLTKNML